MTKRKEPGTLKKRGPKKKRKVKPRGQPRKPEEIKKKRINRMLDPITIGLLEAHKVYGFKSQSAMIDAAVVSIARQRQAKLFETNLIPDKNGVS